MNAVREISWARVKTLNLAKSLIDRSILIKRKDMGRLRKVFSNAEHTKIIRHFAASLATPNSSLIDREKNLESAMIWLMRVGNDDLVQEFVEQLCQGNSEEALRNLIFVTLSPNDTMIDASDQLGAFTVAIICRIGNYLCDTKRNLLCELISAHLLSISNTNNMSVRLLLFNYFAAINANTDTKKDRHFTKIVRRFGSTVLEHVFGLLQTRRSEAFALEYLRLNVPAILRGDYFMQQTLQSMLVNHLYRFPKRIGSFLREFSQELIHSYRDDRQVIHSWLVHITNLYPIASEISDQALAADFWEILTQFPRDEYFNLVTHRLHDNAKLDSYYHANLAALINAELIERDGKILPLGIKLKRRRGRKPSMAKLREPLSALQLTLWIGEQDQQKLRKAS